MRSLGVFLCIAAAVSAQTLGESGGQRGVLMGTAVDTSYIAGDASYSATLIQQYSMIEAETEMKWAAIEPAQGVFDFTPGDTLAGFAQANGMLLRGHNLCWHSNNPSWLTNGGFSSTELYNLFQTYITTVVQHFKGKVFAWDVVNEALADDGSGLRDSIWYNQPGIGLSGPGYIDQAFLWAHAADPNALLFYNDYNVEDADNNPKSDAMYSLVQGMLQRGVPIHGVGLQLHITTDPGYVSPAGLDANIARLTALGLQVHLTELDVRLPVDASGNASASDLAAQQQRYRDIVAVCVKYPGCTAIQTWGFTDKYSWVPSFFPGYGAALPFDAHYQPKSAYSGIQEALTTTPPSLSAAGIVNAAGYQAGAVAPGEIVTVFGANFGPAVLAPAQVSGGKFSNSLANVQVFFDGQAAPLIYALVNQSSAVVPFAVAGHDTTTVQYSFNGLKSTPVTVPVTQAVPAIFALNSSGSGPGAILNQDYSVNTASNPAAVGSYVQVFATGGGLTDGTSIDGALATDAQNQVITPTATVGGVSAYVAYAGTAPGLVNGVMQVNVQIPQVASGPQPLVLMMGSARSQANITVAVK
ncbi:MAG TPA: endo-1,4-beta-xylanase [Bryobacteraceae bacterium]|nr:endo-1,4-beta-xylanase [Bryobacteraceae bacterium]